MDTKLCPNDKCKGDHFWQYVTYRKAGWITYRSPVKKSTHPNLYYCNRNGEI